MPERFTKPGTANVSPADLKKLGPLLKHYRAKAHPFRACYRDQIKHGLSPGHAARRCAVLKDLIHGGTGWRKGGKKRNLSVEELRDIVDLADASGLDCDQLEKARRVLELAEQREAVDMAKRKEPSEDSPDFNWRKHGNRRRGVVLKGGRRVVVSPEQFDRLKAAKQIDEAKTPTLKGDGAGPAKTAATGKEQVVRRRLTRGPRKGQVIEGRIGPDGKFHELKTNTQKGNPRAGKKYIVAKDSKGRPAHIYKINGKRVVVTLKPKKKAKA